jgi:uncharacterized protein (TIGR02996 family)
MTDDDFLEAIRLAPKDNLCRLVYADWLEERGDPRHMFLRAEIKLFDARDHKDLQPLLKQQLQEASEGIEPQTLGRTEQNRRGIGTVL